MPVEGRGEGAVLGRPVGAAASESFLVCEEIVPLGPQGVDHGGGARGRAEVGDLDEGPVEVAGVEEELEPPEEILLARLGKEHGDVLGGEEAMTRHGTDDVEVARRDLEAARAHPAEAGLASLRRAFCGGEHHSKKLLGSSGDVYALALLRSSSCRLWISPSAGSRSWANGVFSNARALNAATRSSRATASGT